MMNLAIMQPYFMPYIGYFQLIGAVDEFIIYDNIKYTKKGWINRNRLLQNGNDVIFSLPLKKGSDSLDVREREIAESFDRDKLLLQIKNAYQEAPYFEQSYAVVKDIIMHDDANLFNYLYNAIKILCDFLEITTVITRSSDVDINHKLKSQDKVLAICEKSDATTYINAIGGKLLYSKEIFNEKKIDLKFIQTSPIEYSQFSDGFLPNLSIIDVIMFNNKLQCSQFLKEYELV